MYDAKLTISLTLSELSIQTIQGGQQDPQRLIDCLSQPACCCFMLLLMLLLLL